MSAGPENADDLTKLLAALTPEKAVALAARLEHEKLKGRGAGADAVLAAIRPVLRAARPPRWPSPQRLFCQAFAEFLVDARKEKQRGRIARETLGPLWRLLQEGEAGRAFAKRSADLTDAILARDEHAKQAALTAVLQTGAETLRAALTAAQAAPDNTLDLSEKLGGEAAVADCEEIVLFLEQPDALAPLRELMPAVARGLNEPLIARFREAYDALIALAPAVGPYAVTLAANALEKPWEAMALARAVARQSHDRLISATDMGMTGELLIADMEALAEAIAPARLGRLDGAELAPKLSRLAAASAGFVREVGVKRDGRWGARIQALRAAASSHVDAMMSRAPQEILGAFPVAKFGAFAKSPRKPDLSRPPAPQRVAEARRWAGLVAQAKPMAAPLGFQASSQAAAEAVDDMLRPYGEALLVEMRSGEPQERAQAAAYLDALAHVIEAWEGPEAAALIRRRRAAA